MYVSAMLFNFKYDNMKHWNESFIILLFSLICLILVLITDNDIVFLILIIAQWSGAGRLIYLSRKRVNEFKKLKSKTKNATKLTILKYEMLNGGVEQVTGEVNGIRCKRITSFAGAHPINWMVEGVEVGVGFHEILEELYQEQNGRI